MKNLPFDYAVRNLGRSPLRLGLSIGGAALVVLLVIAASAFVSGMMRGLSGAAGGGNFIFLGSGSEESIERSEILPGAAAAVAAGLPGIKERLGVPYVSPEVHVALPITLSPDDSDTTNLVLVRAVTTAATLVHPSVQVVRGRFPVAGRNELMIGAMVAAKMDVDDSLLAVGSTVYIDRKPWSIVGRFNAPGTIMDAEAWAALTDIKVHTRRETDSCIVVSLNDGVELADADAFCKQRLDLELSVQSESAYYAALAAFYAPIRLVAWATAILVSIGGLLGGLNTMYAAFASRIRELGMLQCLGFRRSAIIVSLVQESVLATTTGALIACFLSIVLLDGISIRISMGIFGLWVNAGTILIGLCAGMILGLVGALPPGVRALRTPIPESLKAA